MPAKLQVVRGRGDDDTPVAYLRNPRDVSGGERDIRLEGFLNDRLQLNGDFSNLDDLISEVDIAHERLQEQVSWSLCNIGTLLTCLCPAANCRTRPRSCKTRNRNSFILCVTEDQGLR